MAVTSKRKWGKEREGENNLSFSSFAPLPSGRQANENIIIRVHLTDTLTYSLQA